jgi:hypothetical protein
MPTAPIHEAATLDVVGKSTKLVPRHSWSQGFARQREAHRTEIVSQVGLPVGLNSLSESSRHSHPAW